MVYPEEATYPPLERSSYTAGAMILAADALSRTTPASGIFRGEGLPSHLDLTEPAPGSPVEPAVRAAGFVRRALSPPLPDRDPRAAGLSRRRRPGPVAQNPTPTA